MASAGVINITDTIKRLRSQSIKRLRAINASNTIAPKDATKNLQSMLATKLTSTASVYQHFLLQSQIYVLSIGRFIDEPIVLWALLTSQGIPYTVEEGADLSVSKSPATTQDQPMSDPPPQTINDQPLTQLSGGNITHQDFPWLAHYLTTKEWNALTASDKIRGGFPSTPPFKATDNERFTKLYARQNKKVGGVIPWFAQYAQQFEDYVRRPQYGPWSEAWYRNQPPPSNPPPPPPASGVPPGWNTWGEVPPPDNITSVGLPREWTYAPSSPNTWWWRWMTEPLAVIQEIIDTIFVETINYIARKIWSALKQFAGDVSSAIGGMFKNITAWIFGALSSGNEAILDMINNAKDIPEYLNAVANALAMTLGVHPQQIMLFLSETFLPLHLGVIPTFLTMIFFFHSITRGDDFTTALSKVAVFAQYGSRAMMQQVTALTGGYFIRRLIGFAAKKAIDMGYQTGTISPGAQAAQARVQGTPVPAQRDQWGRFIPKGSSPAGQQPGGYTPSPPPAQPFNTYPPHIPRHPGLSYQTRPETMGMVPDRPAPTGPELSNVLGYHNKSRAPNEGPDLQGQWDRRYPTTNPQESAFYRPPVSENPGMFTRARRRLFGKPDTLVGAPAPAASPQPVLQPSDPAWATVVFSAAVHGVPTSISTPGVQPPHHASDSTIPRLPRTKSQHDRRTLGSSQKPHLPATE
ncbi:hypothetical protein BaRGS_00040594 [Batillaria attramentaria]|uniref:Uncharacterized protein n=1 Tax=Batillaria attramentaria TaxID=370345 RepID=A0ABD0IZI3_9CAEN